MNPEASVNIKWKFHDDGRNIDNSKKGVTDRQTYGLDFP